MLIGDKYKIEADALNVSLSVKQGRKGKEQWVKVLYASDPKELLYSIVRQEIRDTGFKDLDVVINKLDEVFQFIKDIIPDEALPQLKR